ncbi:MAG: hypothetical protein OEY50_06280 [Nitrospinota bacterium]|nr:hypothetical protein [Nitrospinota bacterium]MDH5678536.1 hypothetical protein [Nitrospinota bacterium]
MKGNILHVIFLRAAREALGQEKMVYRSTKSSPGYEEYSPSFSMVEPERMVAPDPAIGDLQATIAVKSFRGETVMVETTAFFDSETSSMPLETKNRLHHVAMTTAREYGPIEQIEEYTFFLVSSVEDPEKLLQENKLMIAQLVKDETAILAEAETEDTISNILRYDVDDLAVVGWDGAVLIDKGGQFDDIVALIQLANIQLLSFRILDARLTAEVEKFRQEGMWTANVFHLSRTLRSIIGVRTTGLFGLESIDNSIRLYGDWYDAKAYALAERKLYLEKWRRAVEYKLGVLEKIFEMASQRQGELYNITLEITIVVLILVEIVLILFGKM